MMFQSSFELTGYITSTNKRMGEILWVSKLFRAYGLYNQDALIESIDELKFQSSFELTGYITL